MNHVDYGGAALAYIELIEHLYQDYDVECIVYTGTYNSINERCNKLGIENFSAPYRNFISSYRCPAFLWRLFLRIRHFIGNSLALKKIENDVDMSNIDLIYTNLDRIDIGAILSVKYRIPHVWHIREHLDTDFKILSIKKNYVKYMKKFNSSFVSISESVKKAWLKRGFTFDEIKVIYDGVNIGSITKKEICQEGDLRILFIGGYCAEKGQIDFLKTVAKLDEKIKNRIKIDMYGSGLAKLMKELNNIVEELKLEDRVSFNEYNKDIYSVINEYDVGINYSVEEGFGRVTIEYMAAGVVPIVTSNGASKEIVQNEISGFVVDRNNEEQLGKAISELFNREKYNWMSKNAWQRADFFSMERHAANMHNLFDEEIKKC